MVNQRNNVHVSGYVQSEKEHDSKNYQLIVGIETNNQILPVTVIVEKEQWEKFKSDFPAKYKSATISGQLQAFRDETGTHYAIKAGERSINCFHNILNQALDESESQFHGRVRLERKFDFDTSSNLYLKRLLFRTDSVHPVFFEAMALRGAAPFFDNINEGDCMYLRANYVLDKSGKPPYWRIKHKPQACACR